MSIFENSAIKHVHCIGVGGIGVSALAEMLKQRGFSVSGSDVCSSQRIEYLSQIGVETFVGHHASQISGADLVVYSSAVSDDNPELLAAKEKQLLTLKRGQLLAEFMRCYTGIAIAGTHGKTTTTAMLSHILHTTGVDPTFFIGGILQNAQSPVHIGKSEFFIAEADESDASFLYLKPKMVIATNLEADHLENYDGSEACLLASFKDFLKTVPEDGVIVFCGDDENLQQCIQDCVGQITSYGFKSSNDVVIESVIQNGLKTNVVVNFKGERVQLHLQVAGKHNALNAVAACCIGEQVGLAIEDMVAALSSFPGVGRRLQHHGKIDALNVEVFEDYGHHPTEIDVTIEALRAAYPGRRLVMAFQPHRYSRTRDLFSAFVSVLQKTDVILLLPTYAASEEEIPEANSIALFAALDHPAAQLIDSANAMGDYLKNTLLQNDILIFQGAGDVGQCVKQVL